MIAVRIVLCILAIYLVFIVSPAILGTAITLHAKEVEPYESRDLKKTYFAPVQEELKQDIAHMKAQPYEEVSVTAADGVTLYGDLYNRGEDRTVILFHGYRATPTNNFSAVFRYFEKNHWNMLFVQERHFQKSGGRVTGMGLLEYPDVLSWVEYVRTHAEGQQILLYGMSMGASVVGYASDLLNRNEVQAMVMDCGFTSPYEQFRRDYRKRHLPFSLMIPYSLLVSKLILGKDIRESVKDHLSHTDIPVFFVHGTNDTTVLPHHSEENFSACSSEKELYMVPGANHQMCAIVGGTEYENRLSGFVDKYFSS